MEKVNHLFLERINFVLGKRTKHPWGDALGFRNSRVQSIFQGIPPTADALTLIYRAEKVRLEWLIAGAGGPPFAVNDWMSDSSVVSAVSERDLMRYLITDGERLMVVTTEEVSVEIKNKFAHFTDVNIYPLLGLETLDFVSSNYSKFQITDVSQDDFTKLATGWLGPAYLLDGILELSVQCQEHILAPVFELVITSLDASSTKMAQVAHATFLNEEQAIVDRVKRLTPTERQAFMTLLESLTRD